MVSNHLDRRASRTTRVAGAPPDRGQEIILVYASLGRIPHAILRCQRLKPSRDQSLPNADCFGSAAMAIAPRRVPRRAGMELACSWRTRGDRRLRLSIARSLRRPRRALLGG